MNRKNILIIRFSALGDLVTFEPMFRLIRESFKDANIIFLTSKLGESLYKDINYFDRLIVCKGVVDQIKALKENKFEIIFNLQCTKKSHYVTLFLNKKILINRDSNLFQKIFGFKRRAKSFETMLLESEV
ncbi:MAG: hypothetical protein LBG67_05060 [Campylobacteraceae bacterium]|jgi:ADP-heptose:LPS heptosyltransferase|nr:hypothetical protein [Campylobacteraceae bacterium]